jgi:chemotaxis signal transduction protein
MQRNPQEANPDTNHDVQQHMTFMIGSEEYAVSLLKVKNIIEYDTVTEILRTWEWIREMSGSNRKLG